MTSPYLDLPRRELAELEKSPAATAPGKAANLYRPTLRPASTYTMPRGTTWEYAEIPADLASRRPDLPVSSHRYGVIRTGRVLTASERAAFDLVPA